MKWTVRASEIRHTPPAATLLETYRTRHVPFQLSLVVIQTMRHVPGHNVRVVDDQGLMTSRRRRRSIAEWGHLPDQVLLM